MDEFDLVVIGGGAAGLSAALVLGRAQRAVAVVDAGAPRNAPAVRMQGFLSRDGMAPGELLAVGRDEVTSYGGVLVDGKVTGIEPTPQGFRVDLAGGPSLIARRLLVATGLSDELPDLPGLWERWGSDVLHCPYCHGHEVRDRAHQRPRVWVAGNVANPRAQVITAAGEGSAAAIAINADLVDDDVRRAVAAFRGDH